MTNKPTTVLLIEDDRDYALLVTENLSHASGADTRYKIETVDRLQKGLEALSKKEYDVVLLDLSLPDSKGLETFVRARSQAPQVPIVILTFLNDEMMAINAVSKGAQDYIVKGQVDMRLLYRVLRYAIERHQIQSKLHSLTLIDDLTGLYNRRGFLALAEQQISLAHRSKRGLVLMGVDLDDFKSINDTYGHAEGDLALIDTAEVLKESFRKSDILSRLGGDEFAVMAIEAHGASSEMLRERLSANLNDHNDRKKKDYLLSFSVGAAYLEPLAHMTLAELMKQADSALYEEKRRKPSR